MVQSPAGVYADTRPSSEPTSSRRDEVLEERNRLGHPEMPEDLDRDRQSVGRLHHVAT
jgi:hypothetical protein